MTTPDFEQLDIQAAEDRAAAAAKWKRGYVQIRGALVQKPEGDDRRGPLSTFVNEKQHRALLLYLMLLSVWPWQHDARAPLEAQVWMNLLHSRRGDGRSLVWSESTLSRTWRYLAENGFVAKHRGRFGRLKVEPRLEDGSGAAYTFPSGDKKNWSEVYFTLPDRFWLEQDFSRLGLSGLALLLVIAKETNKAKEIRITQDQIAEWYGFSRGFVKKGLLQLRLAGLLVEREEWIPAPLSKIRTTTATHYSLAGDYSTEERLRARANAERRRHRADRVPVSSNGPVFASSEEVSSDE